MREKTLADELLRLRQRQMLGVDVEDEIKDHEERLMRIRREIVEEARKKIPRFTEIAEKLGLNSDDINDINALSALAGLLVYIRWPYWVPSFHKAKRFLGLEKK